MQPISPVQDNQTLAPLVQSPPKVSQLYPSRYLHAADLNGQPKLVEIAAVTDVELEGTTKLVVQFAGMDKSLVLNKTNARGLAGLYGDDTVGWIGKKIELYPTTTWFRDQTVPCIRLKRPFQAPESEVARP
jgi:hypothetical protein